MSCGSDRFGYGKSVTAMCTSYLYQNLTGYSIRWQEMVEFHWGYLECAISWANGEGNIYGIEEKTISQSHFGCQHTHTHNMANILADR